MTTSTTAIRTRNTRPTNALLLMALRSLRARPATQLAAGLVLLIGSALLTALAALLETGLAASGKDRTLLIRLPAILGGWSLLIVTFGVVSTVSLVVRQRERETALLRTIAASPRQVQILTLVEVIATALPAALAGLVPGVLLGRLLLSRLSAAHAVKSVSALDDGWLTVTVGAGVALTAAVAGAMLAGRRAGQVPPVAALSASAGVDTTGKALTRAKVVTGGVITLLGLGTGMSTLAQENGPLLSSTAGPAGVAVAVGLALLAPAAATAGGGGLARSRSVVMRLAGRTLKTRARQQGSLIAPLTLLIGVGSGTLAMQRIEDSQPATDGPHLATVNYLIVLAIVGFAVVAASNTLVAATRARGHDFKLLVLTGATRRQILAVVGTEALITTVIAAILGGVATAVTVLPFSVVRTGTLIPAQAGPLFVLLVAVALAITILASVPTAVRQIRATATQ